MNRNHTRKGRRDAVQYNRDEDSVRKMLSTVKEAARKRRHPNDDDEQSNGLPSSMKKIHSISGSDEDVDDDNELKTEMRHRKRGRRDAVQYGKDDDDVKDMLASVKHAARSSKKRRKEHFISDSDDDDDDNIDGNRISSGKDKNKTSKVQNGSAGLTKRKFNSLHASNREAPKLIKLYSISSDDEGEMDNSKYSKRGDGDNIGPYPERSSSDIFDDKTQKYGQEIDGNSDEGNETEVLNSEVDEENDVSRESTLKYSMSYSYSSEYDPSSNSGVEDNTNNNNKLISPQENIAKFKGSEDITDVQNNDDSVEEIQNIEQPGTSASKTVLSKSRSIQRDAETIKSIFDKADIEIIYEKLESTRNKPNRVEEVTNALIEGGLVDLTGEEESKEENIFSEVEEVQKLINQRKKKCNVDPNEIFELLERNSGTANRVEKVVRILLNGSKEDTQEESSSNHTNENKGSSIWNDVTVLMKKFPKEDPNKLFELLEKHQQNVNRVDRVCQELQNHEHDNKASRAKDKDAPKPDGNAKSLKIKRGDSVFANDPLLKDVDILSKMFPERDRNELYAYLEAHHGEANRLQIVTEEFLNMEGSQEIPNGSLSLEHEDVVKKLPKAQASSDLGVKDMPNLSATKNGRDEVDIVRGHEKIPDSSTNNAQRGGDQERKSIINKSAVEINKASTSGGDTTTFSQEEQEVNELQAIFPDCDPNYLFEMLEQKKNDPERVKNVASYLFEYHNYPKLKDLQEKEKKRALKQKLHNLEFNLKEFLQMFDEPLTYFYDETKPVTENYKEHAMIQLKNYFPLLREPFIRTVFDKHSGHFTPALRELETEAGNFRRTKKNKRSEKFLVQARTAWEPFPDTPDELFFKELLFTRNELDIKDHLAEQKKAYDAKVEAARASGELHECGCCYDDEVLFEDMVPCSGGSHLFCKTCVRRQAEELIGQMKTKFPCLSGDDCSEVFSTHTLQQVLHPNIFSRLLQRIQSEEIKAAGIQDLETCPFCSFATINPNPNDKVFKCLNPECLKESCRLCKEPNHIPLRCNEVEKQGETSMRTFIENRITEAMLRTCWRCGKRFFKVAGCNKMTCTCGASMCYVCRKPIKDYSHFDKEGCPTETDVHELHRREMEKAGIEAKKKFEQEHPDAAGRQMKYDPMKLVEEYRRNLTHEVHDTEPDDYGSSDDSSDSDTSDSSLSSDSSSTVSSDSSSTDDSSSSDDQW